MATKQQVQNFDSFLIDECHAHQTGNPDLHARAAVNLGGLVSKVKAGMEAVAPGVVKALQASESFADPKYRPLIDAAIALVLAGNEALIGQPPVPAA